MANIYDRPGDFDYVVSELAKADPTILDAEHEQQAERASAFYDAVDNVRDWTMMELVDPTTLQKKFYWRKKS